LPRPRGGTSLGVDAEEFCRRSGVTTAVDTGRAGNFAGFRKHVIESSQVRILAYLHVSHAGISAFRTGSWSARVRSCG
jgi:dihydroorotase